MNQLLQTFLILVTGLIGGLIGGVLISSSDSDSGSSEENSLSTTADSDLVDQLQGVQAELDSLSRRVELQSSTLLTLQDRVAGAIEMDRALRDGRLPSGQEMPLAMGEMPTGPGFDAAVDAIIQQRQDADAVERTERREERRQEQLERRVADLAEQLGLDPVQTTAFSDALDESSVARNAFFSTMRENGWTDRDSIGDKMIEIRDLEKEKLGGILSEEQMGQYAELTVYTGFGGGFGGGNRGGGGNRRGGDRDF